MSSIGSFGTFTTARLAIYVSNKGLSVTGNNIANINTVGYTRQRLDQVSFKTGASDRYQNPYDARVGNGAIAKSVSQLRDPYLDVRYRAEHSSEGYYNGRLGGLDQIAAILDEIGKGKNDGDGLLYAQFSDFFSALQHVQVSAGTQVNDTLASTSAETLCQLFYNAASQLDRLHENTEVQLRQEVDDINSLLTSIRKLNESIQEAEIYGDGALELRDQRNNYIDALSEKLKIDASYSMVKVGGKEVEKLTIRLANANPDPDVKSDSSILVDGNYCAQLTTPKDNLDADGNPAFVPEYEIFDKNSVAYADAIKKLSKDPPEQVANPDAANAFFDSPEALDNFIKTFMEQSAHTMLAYRYVDENGEGTNDPRLAAQVFDDNYNITVSDLRDKNNEPWKDGPQVQDVYVKTPELAGFPQKATYTRELEFSGVWKEGDTITANGNYKVVIGDAPNPPDANTVYVSASAANDDPKNISNALRQALLKDPALAGDYDITTRTTRKGDGFNVQLTVKAKQPELKAGQPKVTITAKIDANPKPLIPIGNVTQATGADNKPIAGRFTAEVTAPNPPFHRGDTITIGDGADAVTLTVGKDLSVNAANDPARLAARLASKINETGFTVSSTTDKDGKAYLVYTAGKDVTGTPTKPKIETKPADPVDFKGLANEKWDPGKAGNVPKPDPKIVDNGDNTQARVVTRYYQDDEDRWHEVTKTTITSKDKMLDDNDLFGELQAVRELLTEEGEFSSQNDIDNIDESAAIKRGIPYYQEALDLLARQFAATMNEANNGYAVDEKGNYLTSKDNGETFEQILVDDQPVSKAGMTEKQQAAVEADALGNFVKANFKGFVKDADGNNTNVLADEFGNPLKLGGMELTTENISINGATLKDLDFAGVNADGKLVKGDGTVIDTTDPADPTKQLPVEFTDAVPDAVTADMNKQALESYVAVNGGYKMGGNLFSNRGDTNDDSGITAKNISVSLGWNKGEFHVVPTYIKLFSGEGENTTQNDNAMHMGSLMDKDLIYNPQDLMEDSMSNYLFKGSFQEFLEKMGTTLGNDQTTTGVSLETHMGQALDIDTSRDSVSAVDLNDEAMDLMQYSHSLTAAYRLMTTLDDMLERLITGTGVTR